jgi:hypothetical protein
MLQPLPGAVDAQPDETSENDDRPIDVPGLSVDESAIIAGRWARRQSVFMPVGDPYAEPDTSVPYSTRVAQHYCTVAQLVKMLQSFVVGLFPILEWGPKLDKAKLRADVIAGLTVGVMLIPQSMSYADIAGLQYKYGLYTSVLPVITCASPLQHTHHDPPFRDT